MGKRGQVWLSKCVCAQGTKCVRLGYNTVQNPDHLPEVVATYVPTEVAESLQTRDDSTRTEISYQHFPL